MVKIFNGQEFALQKELEVKRDVVKLKKRGVTSKLVSIVVGDVGGGRFYQNLKKKAAERVGARVGIKNFDEEIKSTELIKLIKRINRDKNVHGVMVQLPLPEKFSKKDREEIIQSIKVDKDVDGMRADSPFLSPVVKAVIAILQSASGCLPTNREVEVLVVGFTGFEGGKIFKTLKDMGYKVEGANSKTKDLRKKTKKADILISATGVSGLIQGNMIKEGAVVIDVGTPKGEIDPKAYEKTSFITPVPGGVGPVTIACLLENLVEACQEKKVSI